MNEDNPLDLLREMARKKILVEICLTSNDLILGVAGDYHPFPTYVEYGVPVALATDDDGVSRSDMTHEYLRAVETYDFLSYADLKRMARMSLEHSFVAGSSLWASEFHTDAACAADHPGAAKVSTRCQKFLDDNQRASTQWKLEEEFAAFEKKFDFMAPPPQRPDVRRGRGPALQR
jgi:hypothetical protein